MKKILMAMFLGIIAFVMVACEGEAQVASHNLSKSADSFEVDRRVVFFNGITDEYLLSIEGLCSINIDSMESISVTCKTGENEYKKHYLGLSDNVSYFVEQLTSNSEDPFRYKVLFRPKNIIPDVDYQSEGAKVKEEGE